MKCDEFALLTYLKDFFNNNLKITNLCSFDILRPLPSYTLFQRFIKNLSKYTMKEIFKNEVLELKKLGIISSGFFSLHSTSIKYNIKQNNKSFTKSKFLKSNHPKYDKYFKLGIHSASNEINNRKNFEYY